MNNKPKLRDLHRLSSHEPYAINELPDELIIKIGRYLTYILASGRNDVTGTDWGDAFAYAVGGTHLDSPVGIADVVLGKMAWSAKTVKNSNPFKAEKVRLISGRCSPDYSYGISDPHKDIQETGRAVLGIWNERVNLAHDHYNPVRTIVLMRSDNLLDYCIFEEDTNRYRSSDYYWEVNKNGNLIGKTVIGDETRFTWQPHGSQFTIHCEVPHDAVKFSIKRPPIISREQILEAINFEESWIKIIR